MRCALLYLALFVLLIFVGCGSNTGRLDLPDSVIPGATGNPNSVGPTSSQALTDADRRWTLQASTLPGTESLSDDQLTVNEQPQPDGSLKLMISSTAEAPAFFCRLAYDRVTYDPPHSSFGPASPKVLTLGAEEPEGTFAVGLIALQDAKLQPGVLAELILRPASTVGPRENSAALQKSSGATGFHYDYVSQAFVWSNAGLQGDFNLDGRVDFSDMALIGQFFGQRPLAVTDDDTRNLVKRVDANGSGRVDIQDVTALAANFGGRITDFALYGSPRPGDYPNSPLAPATIAPLATLLFRPTPTLGQTTPHYSYQLKTPQSGWNYWLRPLDRTVAGRPSNAVSVGTRVEQALEITADPDMFLYGGSAASFEHQVWDLGSSRLVVIRADSEQVGHLVLNVRYNAQKYRPRFLYHFEFPSGEPSVDGQSVYVESFKLGELKLIDNIPGLSETQLNGPVATFYLDEAPEDPARIHVRHPATYEIDPQYSRLSFDPLRRRLSWYYAVYTDGTQDGLVDLADISPIGYSFNQFVPEEDLDSQAALADFNHDGRVQVADLAPIGLNFFGAVSGFNVYAGAVPPDEAPGTLIRTVPLGQGVNRGTQRRFYDIAFDMPAGTYVWYSLEYLGAEGARSEVIRLP